MKETKQFFAKDNRLNKGYSKSDLKESDHSYYRKRFETIFPPVDLIEAFENLHEGSTDRIIQLAEQEQQHRHNIEKAALAMYERTKRLGIISALFTISIIGYVTLELFERGKNFEAFIFFIVAFICISAVSLLSYLRSTKNKDKRSFQPRNHHNQNSSNSANSSPAFQSTIHPSSKPRRQMNQNYNSTARRKYN